MKRWALLMGVAVFTTALVTGLWHKSAYSADAAAGGAAAPADANSPKIEVTPDSFDFGTVEEGTKPMATFTIKNTGGSELIIYDAKPSCGCTLAELSTKKVMPGETATLEAVYNSQNSPGGKVSKYVTVSSNDPATPSKVLRITGSVNLKPAPVLNLSQYRVDNLQLAAGAVDTRKIQLTNTGQLDLVVSEVTATDGISAKFGDVTVDPGKTVKMELTVKPGDAMEFELDIAPKAAAGTQFQELLTIRSNSRRNPVVTYLARGTVK